MNNNDIHEDTLDEFMDLLNEIENHALFNTSEKTYTDRIILDNVKLILDNVKNKIKEVDKQENLLDSLKIELTDTMKMAISDLKGIIYK